jgi:hypothetical protein
MVGRNPWGPPRYVARFHFELVLSPLLLFPSFNRVGKIRVGALEDDLI